MDFAVTTAATSWTPGALPERPVLVLLHGYGSSEEHLAGVGRAVGEALDVDWASLRAPAEMGPDQYAWFPITTPGRPDPATVNSAAEAVTAWTEEQLRPETVRIPIGFSQGGTVASHLLRNDPSRWPALGLLGSFVLGNPAPGDKALKQSKPPAFSGRGAEDQVIVADAVQRTDAWLTRCTTPTTHSYRGLGHQVSSQEVVDLAQWLGAVLPGLR